jgi:hypothetical protein
MRNFGMPVGPDVRERVLALAKSIFAAAETKRAVTAREFAMADQPPDEVVAREVDLRSGPERLRIAATEPSARPPFEWLLEITSDVGESDYFKHYLVRDDDIVLAQRKVLTPIDAEEAEVVLADLRAAQGWM